MEKSYWSSRWRKNKIGFHSPEPNVALTEFWQVLNVKRSAPVLVPLSGKSVDIDWLTEQGYRVIAVEFVEKACRAFFDERGITPELIQKPYGLLFRSASVDLWCADILSIPDDIIHNCRAVYDCGAIVALPPEARAAYVKKVYGTLKPGTPALLVSFDYDEHIMSGPPFSIPPDSLRSLFKETGEISILHSADIIENLDKFKRRGLSKLIKNTLLIYSNG